MLRFGIPSYTHLRFCVSLIILIVFMPESDELHRFRWPRGLRRWSAAARLLGLRVRIPPGTWMSASSECCALSSRGLCFKLRSPTGCIHMQQ